MTDLRLNFLSLEVLQGIYLQTRESNSNLQDRITQLCGGKWSCWKASSSKEHSPPEIGGAGCHQLKVLHGPNAQQPIPAPKGKMHLLSLVLTILL